MRISVLRNSKIPSLRGFEKSRSNPIQGLINEIASLRSQWRILGNFIIPKKRYPLTPRKTRISRIKTGIPYRDPRVKPEDDTLMVKSWDDTEHARRNFERDCSLFFQSLAMTEFRNDGILKFLNISSVFVVSRAGSLAAHHTRAYRALRRAGFAKYLTIIRLCKSF